MDIKELLNPTPEHDIIASNVTDEEIFESVCECWWGDEVMEINGGNNANKEIINIPSHLLEYIESSIGVF